MHVGSLGTVTRSRGDLRPLAELYQGMVDRAKHLEQLGFNYLHLGEHHFTENQWNPSPLMVLSAIARETSVLRLGTNVLLTPLYHPVRLAEDVATLDLLSNGRVDSLCGSGSSENEFEAYGVDINERAGRVWETMDILRKAYASVDFEHAGKYFNIAPLRMTTQPVQKPFPLWFGGFGPKMLARAGKEGYSLFSTLYTDWDIYLKNLEDNGHDPASLNMGVCFVSMILVEKEEDIEAARAGVRARAEAQQKEYREEREHGYQSVIKDAPPLADPNGPAGTPEQLLKYFEPLLKDSRYTHMTPTLIGDQALFVKEMVPVLKSWGREPVQAGTTPAPAASV